VREAESRHNGDNGNQGAAEGLQCNEVHSSRNAPSKTPVSPLYLKMDSRKLLGGDAS
jgi:hypothetical protein